MTDDRTSPPDPGPPDRVASPDDTALLGRARGGDRAAFGALFDRHATAVFWQAYQVVRDRTEAEDITQDTFVTAWRRLDDIRPVGDSILPWLLVTARFTGLNAGRRLGRNLPLDHEPTDLAPSPEDEVESAAVGAAIADAVGRLHPLDQRLFALCVDGDLTYEQAANELGVTHATVRNRVSRLRSRLRTDLDRREESE